MPSLFADTEAIVTVDFDECTIFLRKYTDAGIQEDLENSMIRYKVKNRRGKKQSDDEETTDAELRMGSLMLLQMMITKIEYNDGKTDRAPISMSTLRKFDRDSYTRLTDMINENNPPLEDRKEEPSQAQTMAMTE